MASSFNFFRKYQRAFIVIAAGMAMFIFVLADPLMSYLQSSGGGANAKTVLVSWDGGSINAQELRNLTERRIKIDNFLKGLIETGSRAVFSKGGEPHLPTTLPEFRLRTQDSNRIRMSCVQSRLFAGQAEQSGISVSNEFINHYLTEWGFRSVSDTEISALLKRARLSDKALFAGLRELLLSHFYQESHALAQSSTTPAERWEDWRRTNEKISLVAAILPARDFVSEVPDPSDKDLKDFYELHKDRFQESKISDNNRVLPVAEPGFKVARKVKIQYLTGNVDDWAQKLEEAVTDEEIAKFYEDNKSFLFVDFSGDEQPSNFGNLFDNEDSPAEESPAEEASEETTTETSDEEAAETEAADSTEEEAAETDSADAEMTEEAAQSETETQPEAETAEAEATEAEETATEEAAESTEEAAAETTETATEEAIEATEEAAEATEGEAAADDQSSRSLRKSPFRLVALQTETEATETTDADETAAEVTEDATEEPAEEAAEEATENEATENEATEETAEATADAEATATATTEASEDEAAPVKYVPLKEVSKKIRRTIAKQKAAVAMQKAIDLADAKLNAAYRPYGIKANKARRENKETPAPPAILSDYSKLAEELGLIHTTTVSLTQTGVFGTKVGSSVDDQSGRFYAARHLFTELELHQPLVTRDQLRTQNGETDLNRYIVCKTEDLEANVPEFDDIRSEVLAAWKNQAASKLALAKAEELAKLATESGDSITTVARSQEPEFTATTTDLFSWYTFGSANPNTGLLNYSLSTVPPLEAVNTELMKQAFDLEADQKIALLNNDHTQAYVIQLNQAELTEEELRQRFLRAGNRWPGSQSMNNMRARIAGSLIWKQISENVNYNDAKLQEYLNPKSE